MIFDRFLDGVSAAASRLTGTGPVEQNRVSAGRSVAGVHITADNAIKVSAVWACIRYLSQTVAGLPWRVLQEGPDGKKVPSPSHPTNYLLAFRISPENSSFQFRETLLHWALRWGNGYAEIERDALGRAAYLWPIHPDRVKVCRDIDTGELYYEISNPSGPPSEVIARNIFHLRGFGDGPVGVNVITYAAQSIGWAAAAQTFGASFFGNGATPSTVVLNKKPLNPDGLKKQKAEFRNLFGGPTRAHGSAHLDNDAKIERIGYNAQETQLVDVHQFLVEEVARWFGVPPHKIGHLLRATFANIEHQSIEVVVDSVMPWVRRFEDEANYKLFGLENRQGFYSKMNLNALLRGDMKARMEFYKGMVQVGAFTPNRVLALEDENGIGEDGDIHVMQEQMVTLDYIAGREEREEKAAKAKSDAKAAAPAPSGPDPDEEDDGAPAALARHTQLREERLSKLGNLNAAGSPV